MSARKRFVGNNRKAEITSEEIQRNPKRAKLHMLRVVPFDFFKEAVDRHAEFLPPDTATITSIAPEDSATTASAVTTPGAAKSQAQEAASQQTTDNSVLKKFGIHSELLYRECYDDIFDELDRELANLQGEIDRDEIPRRLLFEIRGSAGTGKSAFLALYMSSLISSGMQNFALFHVPKAHTTERTYQVECSIWIEGKLTMERISILDAHEELVLNKLIKKLDFIFMDGCTTGLNLEDFWGVAIVAASPSVCTKEIRSQILHPNIIDLFMPSWLLKEMKQAGEALGVDDAVIEENSSYMNGIVRYAFIKNGAKEKVEESVKSVEPRAITTLVATDSTDKQIVSNMVHSLVLWTTDINENGRHNIRGPVRYSLVSRFAERLVAEKLAKAQLVTLQESLDQLSLVSGAEGYAGALFEAYVVKCMRSGGEFEIFENDGNSLSVEKLKIPPMLDDAVVVLPRNELSVQSLPLKELLQVDPAGGKYLPRLVWPKTTNFPTFDAFYLAENGEMYSFQMTIAQKNGVLYHDLNNAGAYQTANYLDAVAAKVAADQMDSLKAPVSKKHKAIFVTPRDSCGSKKQSFTGSVKVKKETVSEKDAANRMENTFDQCILRLD